MRLNNLRGFAEGEVAPKVRKNPKLRKNLIEEKRQPFWCSSFRTFRSRLFTQKAV